MISNLLIKRLFSPLISILSHLHNNQSQLPQSIKFLYTTRSPPSFDLARVLFYDRLCRVFRSKPSSQRNLYLYLTGGSGGTYLADLTNVGYPISGLCNRRFSHEDLIEALGYVEDRRGVVAYICGPAGMTDEVVRLMKGVEGMDEQRVLCEKWW